jgi:hypothetical protein
VSTEVSDELGIDEVVDGQAPGKEDESWVGEPIELSHPFDRYWGGFVGSPFNLPAIAHPRARQAALEVVAAQEHLRELHERRHARVEEYATLIRTGTADEIIRFEAESKILDGRDLPAAEENVSTALPEFAAAYHTTRGELRAYVEQELLPGALKAASASVEAALADLRELALLEQAHSGDGTVLVDQHDTAAYAARADRDVRRRAVDVIAAGWDLPDPQGHVHGAAELLAAYAAALTPPEPEPVGDIQADEKIDFAEPGTPEAWRIRNRALHGEPRIVSHLG